MDRQIVYPGQIPLDTDILSIERNVMTALGYMAQATIGTGTIVDGLACTPTAPASMTVNVGQGSIFALETIDASAFGSLSSDSNPLVKIGINAEGVTGFTLTAPGTSGQSINYLIEATFQEADGTPVVLPYYNPSNPSTPYSGPSNSGVPQNTVRTQRVELQLKAGAAANTGTQTTPAVDSGWVGLWVITVNFGQATITSTSISAYPGAPFIGTKLPYVRGNNIAVYKVISGTQQVSINGAAFTATGATAFGPIVGAARVRIWGGGGGGGGSNGTSASGAGGAGAGYCEGILTSIPSALTVTVGPGGTAGGNGGSPTAGGNGGTSSIGGMSATGGNGGLAGNATIQATVPTGGVGSGGTFMQNGSSGYITASLSTGLLSFGCGGSFGSGAAGMTVTSGVVTGGAGLFPGQGGATGLNGAAGAGGASGVIVVEW